MTAVPVVISPEPFSRAVAYAKAPAGTTVRAMLLEAVRAGQIDIDDLQRTSLYIDGLRVERAIALDLTLDEGAVVNLVVEPLGGGGGGGKNVGQILLQIAVIAVAAWVGGPAGVSMLGSKLAATVAAASVLTLGNLAVAQIFKPDLKGQAKINDAYALQNASNQYRPWAAFPLALGECVVAPDFSAKTFTQSRGEDQWIHGILGLHLGPCEVSELKIGDTLVSSMGAGDFQMVQHLTPGPRNFTLYPNDVDQLDLQEELVATPYSATPVVRAGSGEGERFDFDFFLPQGLHFAKDDGRVIAAQVSITIQYRPVTKAGVPTGSGAWLPGLNIPLNAASKDPWRVTRSLPLPMGRYEFQVLRSLKPDDNAKRKDDVYFTAIRSVAFRKPITDEDLSIIEFAVRASAMNQGTLAVMTCRIKPICQTWTGAQWGPPQPTSNPAALTRWLMTGPAPARALLSQQADSRLREWSRLCDQYNWTANIYLTDDRKQSDVMALLEQSGRASIFWDGTQLAASPWVEKPAPRQLFAGGNLQDHRWAIVYPDEVHALRVEFQNIDEGGDPDELYVYMDGYAEVADPAHGIEAAVLVEALRLEGQKTPERAYRDGRWALGRRVHCRRVDTWATDIEYMAASYGDRVRLAWQRVGGNTSSLVRCRRWSGDLVTGLRLGQPVEMVEGESYAIDMRLTDGLFASVPILTTPGITREVTFANPRTAAVSAKAGDLVAFGVPERISEDTEIVGIEPGEGLTARITGIRYVAPLLMQGETGPIPPLQTRLTGERSANPPAPSLLGVDVGGDGVVRLGFAMPPWKGSPVAGFAVRWRAKPGEGQEVGWTPLPPLGAGSMSLTTPPMREAPVANDSNAEAEVTRVEIEVSAQTVAGQISKPLKVTVVKPVAQKPGVDDWIVTVRGPDADGTQQPGLVVNGRVTDDRVFSVAVSYGLSPEGPWKGSYAGPPSLVNHEINGLSPNVEYWVCITNYSEQGLPSGKRIIGPRVPLDLIAGGLSFEAEKKLLDEATKEVDAKVKEAAEALEAALDFEGLFDDQDDIAEAILKLGRGQSELQKLVETNTRTDGKLVKSVVKVIGGELENAQAAIVEEARLSLERDRAEGELREGLALQVNDNRVVFENRISGVVTDLAAEISARQDLGARVGATEVGLNTEALVRASETAGLGSTLSLLGIRNGNSSAFVLNQETVQWGPEGSLAQVLSGLRATDGTNTSSITGLLQTSANQASQLTTLSSSVGNHTSSISSLLSTTAGLGARWTLAIGVDGVATNLVADGATRSLVFGGSRFAVIDDGNGLSYEPATGRLKIVRASSKIVLGASTALALWLGPSAIPDGMETVDNGILGANAEDGFWGGRTYNGPFDSGPPTGATINLPKNTWTTVVEALNRPMQTVGDLIARATFDLMVTGAPDANNDYSVLYRVAVSNMDGTGGAPVTEVFMTGTPNAWLPWAAWLEGRVNTTRGNKRILLQINPTGSTISTAQARNYRIRGLYGQ